MKASLNHLLFVCAALVAIVCSGCLVNGEADSALLVAIEVETHDGAFKANTVKAAEPDWDKSFSLGLIVSVMAPEYETPVIGVDDVLTLEDETELMVEMDVPPGKARAVDAVLFLADVEPFETYTTKQSSLVDLQEGETKSLTLTVEKQTGGLVEANLDKDSNGWSLGFVDAASGLQLPFIACGHVCDWDQVPVERALIPVLKHTDGKVLSFPKQSFQETGTEKTILNLALP